MNYYVCVTMFVRCSCIHPYNSDYGSNILDKTTKKSVKFNISMICCRCVNMLQTLSVVTFLSFSLSPPGNHLFRPLCAVLPLRWIFRRGPVGGDKLCVPPPQANAAYGQHRQRHVVQSQQHDQPGHIRGVPHQHAGLDDPLAGAQQGQRATCGLHAGQCGFSHHDRHEHCPVLSSSQEWLLEEQHSGDQEREGDVKSRLMPKQIPWRVKGSFNSDYSTSLKLRMLWKFIV